MPTIAACGFTPVGSVLSLIRWSKCSHHHTAISMSFSTWRYGFSPAFPSIAPQPCFPHQSESERQRGIRIWCSCWRWNCRHRWCGSFQVVPCVVWVWRVRFSIARIAFGLLRYRKQRNKLPFSGSWQIASSMLFEFRWEWRHWKQFCCSCGGTSVHDPSFAPQH